MIPSHAMIVLHHPDCAGYTAPGHPENPARVTESAAYLARVLPELEWRRPQPASDEELQLAHSGKFLKRMHEARPFDADTPYYDRIAAIARLATGAALAAADGARTGRAAFSLMRPPGHHATADQAMGFCYYNHVAIAALRLRQQGLARVAIWDFDAHHGNGTEAIVHRREGVLFCSVHQYPGYPGTGRASLDNCLNFAVAPATPAEQHLAILRESWEAVLAFEPDLVLVSAGFDAYEHDPITTMCLRPEDFVTLGSWLHHANRPVAAILEGGYSKDLPRLIAGFLEGWRHG